MRRHILTVSIGCILLLPALSCMQPAAQPLQSTPAQTPPTTVNQTSATQSANTATGLNWKADGIISPGEYPSSKTYGDYQMAWSTDETYIYVGLKAKTSGWVAIGFGAGPMMKNADIIQGYAADGKAEVLDLFSTGEFGPHPADTQLGGTGDIIESTVKSDGGFTTVEFRRKLDTGDKYDKALVKGVNKIIWAFGSEPKSTLKHIVRGTGEIEIR